FVMLSSHMRGTPGHGALSIRIAEFFSSRGKDWAGTLYTPCVSPLSSVVTRVPASGMNFHTTVSRDGGPLRSLHGAFRLYPGLRTIVVWSLATSSLIMNGLLPTGRVCTRSPVSRTALGETMLSVPAAA